MGIQTPITIAKTIENIQSNDYVLPAIQREFVWSTEQVEKLFDSLMRGYPIGSFLFWQIKPENLKDFQFYRFMDWYHERDYRHNEPIEIIGEKLRIAILDGQQRLTALNIGLKGWYADKLPYYRWNNDLAYPKRQLYINLLAKPDSENDMAYEFRMLRESDDQHRDEKHFWFRVGEILQFKSMQDVFKYCVKNGLVSQHLEYPSDTLVRLWQVILQQPVISYFLEEENDLNKVLNIFIRVNSGGTLLSYSDMLLSIATAQWKNLDARNEVYDIVEGLNNLTEEKFNFSKDFILKASLVLSDIKAIEFKVINFNRENMMKIEEQWKNIEEALMITTRLLASWGYNRDTLVSNNAVIPLAYYIFKKGNPFGFVGSPGYSSDHEKMRRWLIRALLKQTFSGQPDNVLRTIRQVISEKNSSFPSTEIYEALSRTAKSMAFDQAQIEALLDYRYGQSMTFTILAMLYPWLKFDQHFHIDHIFPRSMFTLKKLHKLNIPEDQWHKWLEHKDDLANLQFLQGKQNQNKADKEFEEWLCESQPEPLELKVYKEQHMIPDVDLSFENFPEFLEARTEIIKRKLNELLCS
jgi:hypothetical protein